MSAWTAKPHPVAHLTQCCPSQNTVLKTWQGKPENVKASQDALLKRAKANSEAQLGKYDAAGESKEAGKGMYEKGYVYCESVLKNGYGRSESSLNCG